MLIFFSNISLAENNPAENTPAESTPADSIPAESIMIENAWIREAPPNSKIMAAYLDIINGSDDEYVLIAAQSDAFEKIEFHLSATKDSVTHMHKQEQIVIPPHTTFTFKPGSYHFMLFNNLFPMRVGHKAAIQLLFENGATHTVDVPVK